MEIEEKALSSVEKRERYQKQYLKEYWQRPGVKERHKLAQQKYYRSPKGIQKRKERQQKRRLKKNEYKSQSRDSNRIE